MIRFTSLIFIMLLSFNAHAVNPDGKVDECVDVSSSDNDTLVSFVNNCNREVFVIYCGDLPHETIYGAGRCGSAANSVDVNRRNYYYNYGHNLGASQNFNVEIKGDFHYALCDGHVHVENFGYVDNHGEYKEDGQGGYSCNLKHYSKH